MKKIVTDRLILRPFQLGDEEEMYNMNNDPEVIRHTGDIPFESILDAKKFLMNYIEYCKHNIGRFALTTADTKEFMGFCGLRKQETGQIDLGYRLKRQYWGKGYATEACLASINYGFKNLELSEIIGRVARANKASIRVLEKCGMQYWKDGPCEGIEDSMYYRIFNTKHTTVS